MSAKKSTTRAARSPRAATPKAARPWYAPRPRWYADDVEPGLLMRREPQRYVVRDVARCNSTDQAEQLAAALNRGERDAGRVDGLRRALRGAADNAERLHGALRRLVAAGAHVPVLRDGGAFAKALAEARRVLGDEPTFAPGGQEVAR